MAAPVAARWKDAGSFWDVCTWSFLGTLGGEDERQGENLNQNQNQERKELRGGHLANLNLQHPPVIARLHYFPSTASLHVSFAAAQIPLDPECTSRVPNSPQLNVSDLYTTCTSHS